MSPTVVVGMLVLLTPLLLTRCPPRAGCRLMLCAGRLPPHAMRGPGRRTWSARGAGCTVWAMPGSAAPAPKSPSPRLWRMRRVQVAGTAAAAALVAGVVCGLAVGAPAAVLAVAGVLV